MKRTYTLTSYFLILVFSLVNIAGVSAQSISVLGEIKSSGKVFIGLSNGQWSSALPTYPLLENTAIRTEDGNASISFRDGSRVDLSRDTVATITGSSADYVINLAQGVIAFNISPSSSLSVSTPTASISVNSKNGLVQKVGYEKSTRVLGVISATEKGTEVRNISGKILVSSSATGSKTLSTGESILMGHDGNYKVYKTQVVGGAKAGAGVSSAAGSGGVLAEQAAVVGLFGVGATWVYFKGVRSPSKF